jgi:hypothetical protein
MKHRYHGSTGLGMAYAITIYANNKEMAKRELRKYLGVSRLPRGSSVWLAA